MAFVYIIQSKKLGKFYTGSCLDFTDRFHDHTTHADPTAFTAKTDDWEEFLLIDNLQEKQARLIEKHIKTMKSSTYIRNLKRYPELIQKLKEQYL